jgi:peptide/nickel transport system ATP-binding protein
VNAMTDTSASTTSAAPLLQVDDLRTYFDTLGGTVRSVDGLSYTLRDRETLGIVGESGCGKSVSALSIMRLIPRPPGRFAGGTVRYRGSDLLRLSEREMRQIRGNRISMIFQEPMTSLNPVLTVGRQIAETVQLHQQARPAEAMARAVEMLRVVQIPEPARRAAEYPHQLSGGMRQRVMIALALACDPELLIADEPTTALDVTIQAQILDLLNELKSRLGMSIMLITHAMGVVAEMAQRVVVMYAGKVVEEASATELFARPRHPYTQGLIRSIPRIDRAATHRVRLESIAGNVPKLIEPAEGCRFAPRCKHAIPACTAATPPLRDLGIGHKVACIRAEEIGV